MSIESKIENLTAAVVALTAAIQGRAQTVQQPQEQVQQQPAAQAQQMSAPSFTAPAQQQQPATQASAPFSDGQGLMQYVMGAYQAMGAEKGARIQGVLTSLGYSNINEVKPEHYGQLFQGVEALKAGA